MSNSQQEIVDLEKELPTLKRAYESSMQAFLAVPQDTAHVTKRRQALQDYHSAGVAYFNAYERLIALGSLTGADKDPTWYTDKAETASNLLETIERHYRAVATKAEELRLPREMFAPSLKAYSNMQRLVKETDSEHATELRARFRVTGIPTHGFDKDSLEKAHTHGVEWRFFWIGCAFAAVALGIAVWGFSLGNLTKDQRFILRWIFPLASAFASGSFTGSLVTGSKRFWWGLTVAATGGFAVWLLTNLFLLKEQEGTAVSTHPVVSINRLTRIGQEGKKTLYEIEYQMERVDRGHSLLVEVGADKLFTTILNEPEPIFDTGPPTFGTIGIDTEHTEQGYIRLVIIRGQDRSQRIMFSNALKL